MNKSKKEAYKLMDRALEMLGAGLRTMAEENGKYDPELTTAPQHEHRDFRGDDAIIEEWRGLSKAAKGGLCHHLRNTISAVNLYIETGNLKKAQEAVWQLDDVIEQIVEERCTCDPDSGFGASKCAYHERLCEEADHGHNVGIKAEGADDVYQDAAR